MKSIELMMEHADALRNLLECQPDQRASALRRIAAAEARLSEINVIACEDEP